MTILSASTSRSIDCKFAVFKAGTDLDRQSCSSRADGLERLPSRRCPCAVSFSSPLRRRLTLAAKGTDDCVLLSRRSAPSLSPPSIRSCSSYGAPRCVKVICNYLTNMLHAHCADRGRGSKLFLTILRYGRLSGHASSS